MSHVPTTILHYFPGRGLANVIRYTMALAGMEWTEVRIDLITGTISSPSQMLMVARN